MVKLHRCPPGAQEFLNFTSSDCRKIKYKYPGLLTGYRGIGVVKILCVDDDPEFLRILGKMLEERGYEVYLAESGKDALELLKEISPDLILLDVMMPELDGWETLNEIRNAGNRAPVIMLTIMYAIEDRETSFEHGADAHVPKPIKRMQLFKTIEWVLRNSKRRHSVASY